MSGTLLLPHREAVVLNPPPLRAMSACRMLRLTDSLQVCIDAGDPASYTSGDKCLDVSGNGYDFHRGADATTSGSEPTFNGGVGAIKPSAYWSFDGGDYFTYDTTNETWMENLHKDGAAFTALFMVYCGSLATNQTLFGTSAGLTTNVGVRFVINTGGALVFQVSDGSGTYALNRATGALVTAGSWHLCGIGLDETANTGAFYFDTIVNDKAGLTSYATPSAAAATYTMQIGSDGGTTFIMTNTSRMGIAVMWSRLLLAGEVYRFFTAVRRRFLI